jgi:hypothetical protein
VGWSEAILCGSHRVLVAGVDRDEVDAMVDNRIADLSRLYGSALPACRRLLMVDPWGGVATGDAAIARAERATLIQGDVDDRRPVRSMDAR